VHFAAHAYVGESVEQPRKYFDNNVIKTLAMVDALLKADVLNIDCAPVCHVSSIGAILIAGTRYSSRGKPSALPARIDQGLWITNARTAVLSIITGGGKWVELSIPADSLYQHLLLTAEKKFWRCVESGEPPRLYLAEPPKVRIDAVRIIDMSSSNSWAEFAGVFRRTHGAFLEHENAKAELKKLIPEDAKEAIGHGIRAKRSKAGAISFDLLGQGVADAALQ
jgi:hypothetical protein